MIHDLNKKCDKWYFKKFGRTWFSRTIGIAAEEILKKYNPNLTMITL